MKNYVNAILATLIAIGPIGWFFIDYTSGRYDRLVMLFIVSLIMSIVCTSMWFFAVWAKGK